MSLRTLPLLAVLGLMFVAPPQVGAIVETGPAQTINVCTQKRFSWMGKEEKAIAAQSVDVAAKWGRPTLNFQGGCSGSWTVYLGSDAWIKAKGYQTPDSENAGGYHRCNASQCPYAVVGEGLLGFTQGALDHEILEMTVDPTLTGDEICDPVETDFYMAGGITLSDWAFPSYFSRGASPYDYLNILSSPQ